MKTHPIVVGVDSTDCSKAAVRGAAREAQRRDLPLRVTYVYDWDSRDARYDAGYNDPDFIRKWAEGELVVLGSRGRGGFAGLLLGSVSQRVATHALGPVVVVRGRSDAAEGPVAVGVDDSPSADVLLETASEQASGRRCALMVVRAFLPVLPLWLDSVPAIDVQTVDQDTDERARLEEQLAPWRAKYPETRVEAVLTHDSVAGALVEASKHAQLVVVGSRGHGVIAGTLLGSVGLQLLHHAQCPVYIARPTARERSCPARPLRPRPCTAR
jgi:nucleotide-binding universal stress UspA family protein